MFKTSAACHSTADIETPKMEEDPDTSGLSLFQLLYFRYWSWRYGKQIAKARLSIKGWLLPTKVSHIALLWCDEIIEHICEYGITHNYFYFDRSRYRLTDRELEVVISLAASRLNKALPNNIHPAKNGSLWISPV